jgi:hypothetical protein
VNNDNDDDKTVVARRNSMLMVGVYLLRIQILVVGGYPAPTQWVCRLGGLGAARMSRLSLFMLKIPEWLCGHRIDGAGRSRRPRRACDRCSSPKLKRHLEAWVGVAPGLNVEAISFFRNYESGFTEQM